VSRHDDRTVDSAGRLETLAAIATELLAASELRAIATVSSRSGARITTAYFAWGDDFRCVWLSHPDAHHSRNIQLNPSVAIAVYDSAQTWGTPDRGIQLYGRARKATGAGPQTALEVYADRFEAFLPGELSAYRPYEFRPRRLKLF
jgi:uncharacterized protein YhbP (UPF0306 family)